MYRLRNGSATHDASQYTKWEQELDNPPGNVTRRLRRQTNDPTLDRNTKHDTEKREISRHHISQDGGVGQSVYSSSLSAL